MAPAKEVVASRRLQRPFRVVLGAWLRCVFGGAKRPNQPSPRSRVHERYCLRGSDHEVNKACKTEIKSRSKFILMRPSIDKKAKAPI